MGMPIREKGPVRFVGPEKIRIRKKKAKKDLKMDGTRRSNIKIGDRVYIVLKVDQPTGKLTYGKVARILTSSADHHRGIKVMLEDGQVGRVQSVLPTFPTLNGQEYQEGLI